VSVDAGIQALNDVYNKQTMSIFEMSTNFKMKVHCATYVNVKDIGGSKVKMKVDLVIKLCLCQGHWWKCRSG